MRVLRDERVALERDGDVAHMYAFSPFVWREDGHEKIVLRCVPHERNPAAKISSIYYGEATAPLHFRVDSAPILTPDTEVDSGGCEDPTVCFENGTYFIFYSGWNEKERDGNLLLATGSSLRRLKKHGKVLPPNPHFTKCKEASLVRGQHGEWTMFFEYSHAGVSRIGVASSRLLTGPWKYRQALFEPRSQCWDSLHLSTGPIIDLHGPVMFYNGADAAGTWSIGWVRFDETFRRVTARCEQPMIASEHFTDGFRDVAFAASAISQRDGCRLYYSVADAFVRCAWISLTDSSAR